MSVKSDIRDRIIEISKSNKEFYSIRAIVTDVDPDELTCDCVTILDAPDIVDVQLIPRDKDGVLHKGVVLIPKIGSVVFITMLDKNNGFVSMVSEVEEVLLLGDDYGGLIKIEELVTKLNNLENLVNSLIAKYNAHTHTIPTLVTACGAGAGTTTPSIAPATSASESNTLTPTQKVDLENPLIKHGTGI